MQNSFCAQGISCKRKISCQWDFLVQIKSNQIRVVADRARYKPSIHSLYMCPYWGCMHMYMWLWTKPGPMRETHDALGVCTSLTAHNVPRWSRKRQCVRNFSGGGGLCHAYLWVWAPSAAMRTSQSFDFYSFIASFRLSWLSFVSGVVGLGPQTWKQTRKQTNRLGYCLESCLDDSAALDFPKCSVARPQTHMCCKSVSLCMID